MVRRVVKISKTAEWLGNVPNIKDHPKTDASNREIPIPQILLEKLDDGKEHKSTELLFKSMRGSMITNSGVRRMWEMYQRKTGLDITLHQLRHAYATILYEAGIDVKAAQTFLGHANIQTTMDIYTHLSEAKKINSVDIIDKYLTTF
jgi:integrase